MLPEPVVAESTLASQIERLPPEMKFKVFDGLPPSTLATLRATSTTLQASVDGYLDYLIDGGQLVEDTGAKVKIVNPRPKPADILARWGKQEYGTAAFPVLGAPPMTNTEIEDLFTWEFAAVGDPKWQQEFLVKGYDPVIKAGEDYGLWLRVALRRFARNMLLANRVEYIPPAPAAGQPPLGSDTDPYTVLDGIRAGTMEFT